MMTEVTTLYIASGSSGVMMCTSASERQPYTHEVKTVYQLFQELSIKRTIVLEEGGTARLGQCYTQL